MVNKPFAKQIGSLLTSALIAKWNSQLSLRARVQHCPAKAAHTPDNNDTLPRKCDSGQSFHRKVTAIKLSRSLNYQNRSRYLYKLMQVFQLWT